MNEFYTLFRDDDQFWRNAQGQLMIRGSFVQVPCTYWLNAIAAAKASGLDLGGTESPERFYSRRARSELALLGGRAWASGLEWDGDDYFTCSFQFVPAEDALKIAAVIELDLPPITKALLAEEKRSMAQQLKSAGRRVRVDSPILNDLISNTTAGPDRHCLVAWRIQKQLADFLNRGGHYISVFRVNNPA